MDKKSATGNSVLLSSKNASEVYSKDHRGRQASEQVRHHCTDIHQEEAEGQSLFVDQLRVINFFFKEGTPVSNIF